MCVVRTKTPLGIVFGLGEKNCTTTHTIIIYLCCNIVVYVLVCQAVFAGFLNELIVKPQCVCVFERKCVCVCVYLRERAGVCVSLCIYACVCAVRALTNPGVNIMSQPIRRPNQRTRHWALPLT